MEAVSKAARLHPATLDVRHAVASSAGNWATAHQVGELFVQHHPDLNAGWIHRSYAARRMPGGGIELALQLLLPALDRFPDCPFIPYNLACYACLLNDLPRAMRWYSVAEERDLRQTNHRRGTLRKMAMADLDLVALHPWIRGLPQPLRPS